MERFVRESFDIEDSRIVLRHELYGMNSTADPLDNTIPLLWLRAKQTHICIGNYLDYKVPKNQGAGFSCFYAVVFN